MIKKLFAAALMLATSATAAAQDGSEGTSQRTAAGAQRFLAKVAEQSGIHLMAYSPWGGSHINGGGTRWVPESDCVTRIEAPYASIDGVTALGKPENAEKVEAFFARGAIPRPPYKIEWGKVHDLVRTNVACPECGPQESRFFRFQQFYLWFPSVAIADRAEFALKFLIEKCGLPQDEGF